MKKMIMCVSCMLLALYAGASPVNGEYEIIPTPILLTVVIGIVFVVLFIPANFLYDQYRKYRQKKMFERDSDKI